MHDKPTAGQKLIDEDSAAKILENYKKVAGDLLAVLSATTKPSRDESVPKTPADLQQQSPQSSESGLLSYMDDKIDKLTSRYHELSLQINDMKSKLDMPPYQEIAIFARKIFSGMPLVDSVSYKTIPSGMILIIVHKEKSMADVLDQIHVGTAKLEEAFPETYFERWILSTAEARKDVLQDSTRMY